ncbi:MAG: alanine--glyoxylate aminotransferase family protein [Elusimicrobia bacterium]|nr:alanine--glyoxylate aminotransferase family protein [Elusimicrobiota bacterium]
MTNRNIMLTPGPTPLPPQVLEAMSRPLIHHRTEEFGRMFVSVIEDMKWVYRTKNSVLMMTTSGTGAMESAVQNLLSPGDASLICTTGAFGDRFVNIHKAFGIERTVLPFDWGTSVDPDALRKALRSVKRGAYKAVFFQHTDTSTGVVNVEGLRGGQASPLLLRLASHPQVPRRQGDPLDARDLDRGRPGRGAQAPACGRHGERLEAP